MLKTARARDEAIRLADAGENDAAMQLLSTASTELRVNGLTFGAEITRAEQALERYDEAFEQGRLSPERCEERLSRLRARLEDLHAQQAELAPLRPGGGRTGADPGRSRSRRRPTRGRHYEREPQRTRRSSATDPGATGQRTSGSPTDLQARDTRGSRNVRKSGACRARTGDPQLAKPPRRSLLMPTSRPRAELRPLRHPAPYPRLPMFAHLTVPGSFQKGGGRRRPAGQPASAPGSLVAGSRASTPPE